MKEKTKNHIEGSVGTDSSRYGEKHIVGPQGSINSTNGPTTDYVGGNGVKGPIKHGTINHPSIQSHIEGSVGNN